MENFMAAEAWVVAPGPFDGVEDAPHRVQHAPQHQPEKAFRREDLAQGIEGHHRQPPHKEVDAGGQPAGRADPHQGQHQAGQRQPPDHPEQGPAPSAALPQGDQAHRGIRPGNEKIDGTVVEFAQGDAAPDAGIDAVIEGTGRIKGDHGQAVDQERDHVPGVRPQRRAAQQQGGRPHNAQHRPHTVGDGRPGAQAVIGIPPLLLQAGAAGLGLIQRQRLGFARKRMFITHENHLTIPKKVGSILLLLPYYNTHLKI